MLKDCYYKLGVTDKNRVWNHYLVLNLYYSVQGEERRFGELYGQQSLLGALEIEVQGNGNADAPASQDSLPFPPFFNPDRTLLIRGDLVDESQFSSMEGIRIQPVQVAGGYRQQYGLLYFTHALDCVDRSVSQYEQWVYTPPTLSRSLIPEGLDGFFLAGWHSGESHNRHNLYTIVSQRMKKYLSGLEKAKSFLTFTPMPISEEGLGATLSHLT